MLPFKTKISLISSWIKFLQGLGNGDMGKAHQGPGQCSGAALPSGFQSVLRPPAMPVVWLLMGLPVKLLVPQSSIHPDSWISAQVDYSVVGRPHPLELLIVLVLTPPELWRPLAFHRLLLLGLLLSLFFIGLTLGSHSKKFSLLHLLSLRNWKKFFPP